MQYFLKLVLILGLISKMMGSQQNQQIEQCDEQMQNSQKKDDSINISSFELNNNKSIDQNNDNVLLKNNNENNLQPQYQLSDTQYATFGLGCFWCAEALFNSLKGVIKVQPGYSGGLETNFTYEDVKAQKTGHYEVVQIMYDQNIISYQELIKIFWDSHDPTQADGQGEDIGNQYKSIIFTDGQEQKKIAQESLENFRQYIKQLKQEKPKSYQQKYCDCDLATEIRDLEAFYEAESYHNNYFELNPNSEYCETTIKPKVEKFKSKFQDKLKSEL